MDFEDETVSAFREMMNEVLPGTIVSNYIVVAEVQDGDGSRLSVGLSDGVSPWLAIGMLESALDMVLNGQVADSED